MTRKSRSVERDFLFQTIMEQIAIQGIAGCYHETAARGYFADREIEVLPCLSFDELFARMAADPALLGIAAIEMTVLYSRGQEQERKQLEQEIAAEMDTENQNVAMEEETEADQVASILKPQTQSTETAEVEKESEEADSGQEEVAPTGNTSQALHFAAEDGILWPMEGNVILDYSMDSTVYFATLDQYKYNPAVIIAGDVNSKVYAVAKGKIQSIETNEVTGCTVTEDLGDGYLAVYGQLKEPEFAVGDYVEAGHVIGYVTEPTKYYSVEGSNLYFELRKDGVPVDPIEFFE